MASGKAIGPNRDYQVFVKNILIHRNPNLTPYQDDGVDITFNISEINASMTMDIVLQDDQGDLIVGECKRWKSPVKQNEIFAFQKKLEELRKVTEKAIIGVFFVKHAFQLGAIKFANHYGIRVVTCNERQPLEGFSLTNLYYDSTRDIAIREGEAHLSGIVRATGHLSIKVIRANGTVEEFDAQ